MIKAAEVQIRQGASMQQLDECALSFVVHLHTAQHHLCVVQCTLRAMSKRAQVGAFCRPSIRTGMNLCMLW